MRMFPLLILSAAVAINASVVSAQTQTQAPTTELTLFKGAQNEELPSVGGPGQKIFYKGIAIAPAANAPMSCSMFKIGKGDPLTNKYEFAEVKLVTDGSMNITDGKAKFTATKGDVVFIPKGAEVTFSSDDSGTAFLCSQH